MNIKGLILAPIMAVCICATAMADGIRSDIENTLEYRMGLGFRIKLIDNLKLDLEPELRFTDGGLDVTMFDLGLTYKSFGCIYWGATYRIEMDREESNDGGYNMFGSYKSHSTESYGHFALDVTYKDRFGRFTPSFRLRYSGYFNEEVDDDKIIRYRAKVDYDIRRCKFTPYASVEAYTLTSNFKLYKVRYSAGVELRTSRNGSLSLDYKLDYFNLKYKNSHIISSGYNYKF